MTLLNEWLRNYPVLHPPLHFMVEKLRNKNKTKIWFAQSHTFRMWQCWASNQDLFFFFFNFFFIIIIYFILFIYGCVGSSFLCEGFLQLWQAGATLHRGARVPHYRGLSCCGAQAPDARAQQLWLTGPVAPWHVGSSQTRARTRVPCIGRQTLNHCATREAPNQDLLTSITGFSTSGHIILKKTLKKHLHQHKYLDRVLEHNNDNS